MSNLRVHADGHVLSITQEGYADCCIRCDSKECEKIAIFNKYYRVKVDPRSDKGWHVVEGK